jgi:hypothetical protein
MRCYDAALESNNNDLPLKSNTRDPLGETKNLYTILRMKIISLKKTLLTIQLITKKKKVRRRRIEAAELWSP